MEEHCIWHIGYGQSVSAWEDRWIDSNIRIADFNLNTPPHLQLAKVDDLGSNGVSWKWGELKEWLPMKIIRRISTKDGDVSDPVCWRDVWKINAMERVRHFVWLLHHDGLLTNMKKSRMGLGSTMCRPCGVMEEDALHVFRDCPRAVDLWRPTVSANNHGVIFLQIHNDNFNRPSCKGVSLIKWEAPLSDWVKMNIDGAMDKEGNSGCSGIIRGSGGEWLGGFSKNIGICSVYTAEFWGSVRRFNAFYKRGIQVDYYQNRFSTSGKGYLLSIFFHKIGQEFINQD
ncbi:hypothetical protein KIW84_031275 [Lathyrus oleraceus]|uniref:Reverse transcriptase zinc-binding domain-containing protein n=1 Tax=Pisum sativum TaxID=3888 RepID=A0A9D5B0E1_PEA|nr:hypothetical protein KIW84_031275 [Pisum sativum]